MSDPPMEFKEKITAEESALQIIETLTKESIQISIGKRLRDLRKTMGKTQKNISDLAGVSFSHISGIELGNVPISLDLLNTLATIYEVRLWEICCDIQTVPPADDTNPAESIMSTPKQKMGRKIRDRRDALGYTQGRLGAFAGVSASAISEIERGLHSTSMDTYAKIAAALRVPLRELLMEMDLV